MATRCAVWQRRPAARQLDLPGRTPPPSFVAANEHLWGWITYLIGLVVVAAGSLARLGRPRDAQWYATGIVGMLALVASIVTVAQWFIPLFEVTSRGVRIRGGLGGCQRLGIPAAAVISYDLEQLPTLDWAFRLTFDPDRIGEVGWTSRWWTRRMRRAGYVECTWSEAVVPERRLRQALRRLERT